MANNLYIRVSVLTYDENDVVKSWPHLFTLVWPDGLSKQSRGVLELSTALTEAVRYDMIAKSASTILAPFMEELEALLLKMEEALGDQDLPRIRILANQIEAVLDDAEKSL